MAGIFSDRFIISVISSSMNPSFNVDHILKDLVPADCISHMNSFIQHRECDPSKYVLEVIVSEHTESKSDALFFCSRSCWSIVRALVQILSVDGFIVFGVCHARVEPNGSGSVELFHSASHVISSSECLCHENGLIWFQLPLKYCIPFQWLAANRLTLNLCKIVCERMILNAIDGAVASESELVFKINCHATVHLGLDAVHTFSMMSEMCHKAKSLHSVASHINVIEGQRAYNSDQSSIHFEVIEFDSAKIKNEMKCDDGENAERPTEDSRENFNNIVSVSDKFCKFIQKRKYHFNGSSRMLILQCPGCAAEFRGLSNRLYRLISHIHTRHPKSCAQFMNIISKRYSPLINEMYKFMSVME